MDCQSKFHSEKRDRFYHEKAGKVESSLGKEDPDDEKTEKKYKHLILDNRIGIQECLQKSMTFKAISKRIGKDATTVSKELSFTATYNSGFIRAQESCPLHLRAPFVCNGCEKQSHSNCCYPRRKYLQQFCAMDLSWTKHSPHRHCDSRTFILPVRGCFVFLFSPTPSFIIEPFFEQLLHEPGGDAAGGAASRRVRMGKNE